MLEDYFNFIEEFVIILSSVFVIYENNHFLFLYGKYSQQTHLHNALPQPFSGTRLVVPDDGKPSAHFELDGKACDAIL